MANRGIVDWTTIYTLVSGLEHQCPEKWSEWVWRSVLGLTCLPWAHSSLVVAPNPSYAGGVPPPYSFAVEGLRPLLSVADSPSLSAIVRAKSWTTRNRCSIKQALDDYDSNENMQQWIGWAERYWFVPHSSCLGALFDKNLIPQIAGVLQCSESDLKAVHARSGNLSTVRSWARGRDDGEDLQIVRRAYTVASIARGRSYRYHAAAAGLQFVSHPVRGLIEPPASKIAVTPLSNVAIMLASIIVHGAMRQRSVKSRVALWADSVSSVARAYSNQEVDLRNRDSIDVALAAAIESARKLNLVVYPKHLETFAELVISVGFGVVGFFMSPWLGPILSGGQYLFNRKISLGGAVVRGIFASEGELRDLATRPPCGIQVGRMTYLE